MLFVVARLSLTGRNERLPLLLANFGVSSEQELVVFGTVPVGIWTVLLEDLGGLTHSRLVPMGEDTVRRFVG